MALAALCFVWAGLVLGISFLETPVKFTAPSVTLIIGLDIGRHVFGMLNRVECGLMVVCVGLALFYQPARAVWLPLGVAVCVVVMQTVWLLPVLNARVAMIMNGVMPPPAPYHSLYAIVEVLKLIGLLASGAAGLSSLRRPVPNRSQ